MSERTLFGWAVAAGVLTGAGFVVGLFDPAYYAPVTGFDYLGSILNDAYLAVSGLALIIWSRATPVPRTRILILVSGVGLLLWTVGNVLEEIVGLDVGTVLFFAGSITAFTLTAAAGVVTLFNRTRWRWSGLVLLGIAAGVGVEAIPFVPIAWLSLSVLLARDWFNTPAQLP